MLLLTVSFHFPQKTLHGLGKVMNLIHHLVIMIRAQPEKVQEWVLRSSRICVLWVLLVNSIASIEPNWHPRLVFFLWTFLRILGQYFLAKESSYIAHELHNSAFECFSWNKKVCCFGNIMVRLEVLFSTKESFWLHGH